MSPRRLSPRFAALVAAAHHRPTWTALAAGALLAAAPHSAAGAAGAASSTDGTIPEPVVAEPVPLTAPAIPPAQPAPPPMLRCLLPALIPDLLARCWSGAQPTYHVYVALSLSIAHDTHEMITRYDFTDPRVGTPHLTVGTPMLTAALESPGGVWGLNASMLVDLVSAPDIVTSATSPRTGPSEVRYAPALGAHRRFGDVDVNLRGAVSRRAQASSTSGGGGVAVFLRQKAITPSLDYTFTYDTLRAAGAPLSPLHHDVSRHTVDLRVALRLDEATLFLPTFTMGIESGDWSRPYRHVPMFSADVAARIPADASLALVGPSRLSIFPLEQLPATRQRFALGALLAHRFSWSTLRAEERLAVDSWGVKASTTSVQWLVDAGTRVRLWPDVRAHVQSGADFWRLAYVATPTPSGWKLPPSRTNQVDLGPLVSVTGGAGVRVALDEKNRFALLVSGGVNYTRFLDHLYVTDRIGPFGATTLEADVQ